MTSADESEGYFSVVHAVRAIRSLPDGTPCPSGLKHTLLVLATYWPHIWPGQERLAVDLGVTRAAVNRRMRRLEDAGLIGRIHRGKWRGQVSTLYKLKLRAIRKCAAKPIEPEIEAAAIQKEQTSGTSSEGADGNEWGFR